MARVEPREEKDMARITVKARGGVQGYSSVMPSGERAMGTVQKLRAKAQASGNLKTTKEQIVKVEQQVIVPIAKKP